ncbi:hypothetical protein LZ189_16210, partial [Rhodovulum sulfidophilum]|nr:hypothetical protein [Rhodovulum sulfidophilum]
MPAKRENFAEETAAEIFVDRNDPKRVFENAARSIPAQGCLIHTWYGPGGQGKSALARELFRMSAAEAEPSYAHLRRALVPLQGKPKTDPIFLLIWIRNAFAKAGVSFRAFDLSLAFMWEKTRSGDPFPTLENPWLHRAGNAMSDALPDGVGLVREALEDTAGTIPLLGFLAKRGTRWAFDKGKKTWLEKSRPQLQAFYRNGALIEDQ